MTYPDPSIAGRRRHIAGPMIAGVFAVAALLLFLLMNRRLNMYDEGIVLVDAMRGLNGDVIHRDYYTPYGPAASNILAWLFRLDGHWFLIGRLYAIVIMAGIVAASFGLLLHRTRAIVTITVTAACGAWLLTNEYYLYPLLPCLLLGLIGSALLLRWAERGVLWALYLAGAITGLTTMFRYDVGFLLMVGHLAAMAIIEPRLHRAGKAGWRWFYDSIRYGVGVSAVFLPCAFYFLSVAPLAAFYHDIIYYPTHYYTSMRALPFPRLSDIRGHLENLGVYLPFLAAFVAAIIAFLRRRGNGEMRHDARSTLFVVIACLMVTSYSKGMVRVSALHMMMSIIPATMLLGLCADMVWDRARIGRPIGAAILAVAIAMPTLAAQQVQRRQWQSAPTPLGDLLQRGGSRVPQRPFAYPAMAFAAMAESDHQATDYVRSHTRPDERIFVANGEHDRTFADALSFYFATQRQPGTHWHEYDPGLESRADVQRLMIGELQANDVEIIIKDPRYDAVREPNGSARSSGVFLLDRYIARHYRPVAVFGDVQILRRAPGIEP